MAIVAVIAKVEARNQSQANGVKRGWGKLSVRETATELLIIVDVDMTPDVER